MGTMGTTDRVRRRAAAAGLVAVLALLPALASPRAARASDCSNSSVGLTPLSDLGSGTYKGSKGGLYPGSVDFRPVAHERAGESIAQGIGPLDATGAPDPDGKYVLLSIGMSNTKLEFHDFQRLVYFSKAEDPHLVLVDGAQIGATAKRWADPGDPVWAAADQSLAEAGVSAQRVTVAWVKLADSEPRGKFPSYARELQSELEGVARNLHARYPNLKLAYYSSRIYGGYAVDSLNPEPYAYQSGFSVKWLVGDQLAGSGLSFDPAEGPVDAPWVAWGPYMWADGLQPRSDGLTWACTDFAKDGTHPSDDGEKKVAGLLMDFFSTDSTTRPWFLAAPGQQTHARTLSLSLTKHLVAKGALAVDDGFGACGQGDRVDVERRTHGRWRIVGEATTGRLGKFRVKLDDVPGTYRATTAEVDIAGSGSDACLAATSPVATAPVATATR